MDVDDQPGTRASRVRKKSAKVIEMEEAAEFERKINKKEKAKKYFPSPNTIPQPIVIKPPASPPQAKGEKIKTPTSEKPTTDTILPKTPTLPNTATTPKITATPKTTIAPKSTSPRIPSAPKVKPKEKVSFQAALESAPSPVPPRPIAMKDSTKLQATSLMSEGGLKLKIGIPNKSQSTVSTPADTALSPTNQAPSTDTPKKVTKKRKKERQEPTEQQDDVEITSVKIRKKKKRLDGAKQEASETNSAIPPPSVPVPVSLVAAPVKEEEESDNTSDHTHSASVPNKQQTVKKEQASPQLNITGLIGPIMEMEDGNSEEEEEFQRQLLGEITLPRSLPSPPQGNNSPPPLQITDVKSEAVDPEVKQSPSDVVKEETSAIKMEDKPTPPPPVERVKGKRGRKPNPEPKKKRKRRPTAYTMWCNFYRPKVIKTNPGISKDFAMVSRRLGEIWQAMPNKEKMTWKRKARKVARKGAQLITTGKKSTLLSKNSAPPAGGEEETKPALAMPPKLPAALLKAEDHSKVNSNPIDVAAHLKLLGESLSIIGSRLQEHRGQIAVQGSLSVLLDSILCSLGPLSCLCNVVPELTDESQRDTQSQLLHNIAYIMPGIG